MTIHCFRCGERFTVSVDEYENNRDCPECHLENMGGRLLVTDSYLFWYPDATIVDPTNKMPKMRQR